jgi:hypothetical protein
MSGVVAQASAGLTHHGATLLSEQLEWGKQLSVSRRSCVCRTRLIRTRRKTRKARIGQNCVVTLKNNQLWCSCKYMHTVKISCLPPSYSSKTRSYYCTRLSLPLFISMAGRSCPSGSSVSMFRGSEVWCTF